MSDLNAIGVCGVSGANGCIEIDHSGVVWIRLREGANITATKSRVNRTDDGRLKIHTNLFLVTVWESHAAVAIRRQKLLRLIGESDHTTSIRIPLHSHTHNTHNTSSSNVSPTHTQHSTAQHSTDSTAQHNTRHNTAQHSTAQHSTAQYSTAQHSTAQHNIAQHSTVQYSTAQHNTNNNKQNKR